MRLLDLLRPQLTEMAAFRWYIDGEDYLAFFSSSRERMPTTVIMSHYGGLKNADEFTVMNIRPKIFKKAVDQLALELDRTRRPPRPEEELLFLLEKNLRQMRHLGVKSLKTLAASGAFSLYPNLVKSVNVKGRAKLFQMMATMGMGQAAFQEYFGEAPEMTGLEEHGEKVHNAVILFPDEMRETRKKRFRGFLDDAYQALARQGLSDLFAGMIAFAPLRTNVAGDWSQSTKQMRINPKTSFTKENTFTLLHEYGHKYWYNYLPQDKQQMVLSMYNNLMRSGHTHDPSETNFGQVFKAAEDAIEVGTEAEYIGRGKRRGRWKVVQVTNMMFPTPGQQVLTKKFIARPMDVAGNVVDMRTVSGPVAALLSKRFWKLLNVPNADQLPDLDESQDKGDIVSDQWFPTSYSMDKAEEWWAELFGIHMMGNLHGEPAKFMNEMLKGKQIGEARVDEYDWSAYHDDDGDGDYDEWQPESYEIAAGTIVYHGTQAPLDWWDERDVGPDTPFWVTDQKQVAEKFATWNEFPGEMTPRLIAYKLTRPLKMILIQGRGDMEAIEEYWGIDTGDPREWAEEICAKGFDGWTIPDNYQPGADIMICDSDALEYVGTEPLQKAGVGGWEGQTL